MTIPTPAYRAPARWIHWLMALMIIPMIPAGFIMIQDGLPRAVQDAMFISHKNMGTLLLILIIVRLIYRWRNAPPPEPSHLPAWQVKVAGITHILLYALLLIMPLAGYIRVRAGGFPIEVLDAIGLPTLVPRSDALAEVAKSVHFYCAWALALLIAMHVGAALHHAIIKRDGVFSRMWPRAS